jgi:hypothetical protein
MSQQKNNPKMTRLYHFNTRDHAISNIQKQRLKIARWDDLNDPFELRNVMPSKVSDERFDRWRNCFANTYGLLCFSKIYSNPVMWGHYAKNASGLVLGFDIPESDELMRVKYCNCFLEPPTKPDDEKFAISLFSTKAKDWEYEDEVRIFQKLSDAKCEFQTDAGKFLYFEPFSTSMKLREILLGVDCKADQSTINAMKRYVTPDVEICRTVRSKNKFEIVKTAPL